MTSPQRRRYPHLLWTIALLAAVLALAAAVSSRATQQLAATSSVSCPAWAAPSWAPPGVPAPETRPAASPSPSSMSPAAAQPIVIPPHGPAARQRPSGTSGAALDLAALAAKADPAVVDINTQLSNPNVQGAGTGIVLDPSGVVLTNNHVINGAGGITVTDVGNGQSYPATVVGYDRAHDVAVLQLAGATGLPTATIGDSDTVSISDQVAAIGNAGGRGGTPSIVAGVVSALNQAVAVRDDLTGSVEHLAGLIQVAADIQPGDSGGPLVNAAGEVIGVDTAGAAGSPSAPSTGAGLAIPINHAIAISRQIRAGGASDSVHIGATGVLGVLIQDAGVPAEPDRPARQGHRHHPAAMAGAAVGDVVAGSPAEQAGLAAGSVIVSLDGTAVDSPDTVVTALTAHHPGDSVQVGCGWTHRVSNTRPP